MQNRGGDFEYTRNLHTFVCALRRVKFGDDAVYQQVGHISIVPGLNDQDLRSFISHWLFFLLEQNPNKLNQFVKVASRNINTLVNVFDEMLADRFQAITVQPHDVTLGV